MRAVGGSAYLFFSMELKRVVVTGLGAVTPVGNTPQEMWENLLKGVSGAAPITHFDTTNFKTKFACEVKNLDMDAYLDRKEARKMDRYTQLALIAAKQAVEDCGWDLEQEDKDRIGVVFGVGIGGIKTFEEEVSFYATHKEMGPKFNPFFIPKMIADIAAGQISIMYGFHGPNYITSSACASSSNALADAFNLIRLGKANAIVAGGAEAAITEALRATTSLRRQAVRSAQAATDSSWPRVPAVSSWRSWSTQRLAVPRSMQRWWVQA